MRRPQPPLYPWCPAAALDAARLGVPVRPVRWTAWDALWAVLGSFVIANGVAVLAIALGLDIDAGWVVLSVLGSWVALAGWPLWVTMRRGNGIAVDLGWRFRKNDILGGLVGGAATFGAAMLAGLVTVLLFGEVNSAAGEQAAELANSSGPIVLVVFAAMVVFGAPVAEELAFRGLLWSGVIRASGRPWVAIAVSAGAFALVHFEPERLLILLAVGTVLGIVRWRTGSLGASIIAHAVNNAPGAIGILVLAASSSPG